MTRSPTTPDALTVAGPVYRLEGTAGPLPVWVKVKK